jgi:maltose/moltooligosaccharide transporter
MGLVGVGWASIMAMPYVMLAGSVPENRMGVYMGIFNMFIVVPQIISMLTVPLFYDHMLSGDPRNALLFAGILLFFAAAANFIVSKDVET